MQRWFSHTVIVGYLGVLLMGLVSHAIMFGAHSHPLMYLVVWDMYCGWSAFETRYHVLGETYDGEYYQVMPPPWGEFHPYQGPGRQHYDVKVRFLPEMAEFVLAHTEHEPIRRVLVVEEAWSKKYNLPDALWSQRHDEPKDKHSYYHLRAVSSLDSDAVTRFNDWPTALANQAIADNPRLMSDVKRGHTFFAIDASLAESLNSGVIQTGYNTPVPGAP